MNTSDVINRLTHHRTRQVPFLNYLDKADPKLSSRLAACGSWLHVREWDLSGESRLKNANFCKQFLVCTCCASRRAGKMVEAYRQKVEILQDMYPGLIPVLITLTVRNGPDLRERIQHIKDSRKRMLAAARKGKSESGRHSAIEWNKVLGSICAVEVTWNKKTSEWHPHLHFFAFVSEYISPAHLSSEWERFTGDSFIVDVRKVKNGIVGGLIEVLKYVSKPTELSHENLLHLYNTAKGTRFVDPHGLMRGVPEPTLETDDDDGLHGPYRDYILLWSGRGYSMQAVGHRLEILKPGDSGYGAPRELVADDPCGDPYAGIAFPPEHLPPPRQYYPDDPAPV